MPAAGFRSTSNSRGSCASSIPISSPLLLPVAQDAPHPVERVASARSPPRSRRCGRGSAVGHDPVHPKWGGPRGRWEPRRFLQRLAADWVPEPADPALTPVGGGFGRCELAPHARPARSAPRTATGARWPSFTPAHGARVGPGFLPVDDVHEGWSCRLSRSGGSPARISRSPNGRRLRFLIGAEPVEADGYALYLQQRAHGAGLPVRDSRPGPPMPLGANSVTRTKPRTQQHPATSRSSR